MSERLRHEDWQAELRELETRAVGVDGITCAEISGQLGRTPQQVRVWLHKALAAGSWEYVGRKYADAIDGTKRPVPCYRPVRRGVV